MLAFDRLAFDRGTIRSLDKDGRLHIGLTPISKAMVCPYIGHEIPGWEDLGLDPEKIYRLYRDPAELEKAAPSFNRLPLLSEHVPVDAENYAPNLVVGSTGESAQFKDPYLLQSMVVWAQPSIDGIMNNTKKELSAAYHYTPDMTPGTANGEAYDGVMRNITGNHQAVVVEGRSGHDVVVGDSLPSEIIKMTKPVVLSRKAAAVMGALAAHFAPKLAQDAKIDFAPILKGVTHKNYDAKKAEIVKAVEKAVEGKLAQDATPQGLSVLLDALSMCEPQESMDNGTVQPPANAAAGAAPVVVPDAEPADPAAPAAGGEDPMAGGGDPVDAMKKWLASKLQPQDMAMLEKMIAKISSAGGAADPAAPTADDGEEDMPGMDGDDGVDDNAAPVVDPMQTRGKAPGAMDAKITQKDVDHAVKVATSAATKIQRDIRDAEREVRPYVGELAMSFDSAAAVRRHALKALKVEGAETVHESALSAMLKMVPVPGSDVRPAREARLGMDAAAAKSLDERFGLSRIGTA